MKNFTQLHSGLTFEPKNPKPESIDTRDIALSLSRLPRYLGNTSIKLPTLSVAQHCIAMALVLPNKYKFEALLHDACECYIGDIPYPVKQVIPGFKELEDEIWAKAIAPKYQLPESISPVVKQLDREIIAYEYEIYASDDIKKSNVLWDFHTFDILKYNESAIREYLRPMDFFSTLRCFTELFEVLVEFHNDEISSDILDEHLMAIRSKYFAESSNIKQNWNRT